MENLKLAADIEAAIIHRRNPSRCSLHRLDRRPPLKVGLIVPNWSEIKPALQHKLMELATGHGDWPLYLHGDTGVGKSCAAAALVNRTANAPYLLAEQLCDAVYAPHAHPWPCIKDAELVVIDEVGLRPAQDQRAFLAMDQAARLREHRPTIWISNHGPDRLRQLFDDRLYSRLTCGTVIELTGPDRRKETQ